MKNEESLPHASGIYKITNLINGKVYIGQSKDIYNRYHRHHKYEYKNEQRSDFHLYQAFKKYGLDNFSIDVVELCDESLLDEREIYWIKYYDSFNTGYNMTEGGQFFSPKMYDPETEKKRAATRERTQALVGENHPRAKLTNAEVENIRKRYINGESSKSIYEDYKNIYDSIDTFKQIILGTHYKNVGFVPTKLDIKLNNKSISKEDIIEMRRQYYLENATMSSLAQQYKLSTSSIQDIVNRKSYKEIEDNIPNKRKREKYRLTPDQVREIREKANNGVSVQELAAEYCIDSTAIRKCIKRQTYKNIE